MKNPQSDVSVFVTTSPQRDGVTMSVTNDSKGELRIRFPNPYTGIRLYTESGEHVTLGRTMLCWEENDPEVVLSPSGSASAIAYLSPFWSDLDGTFLARCKLTVTAQEGESQEVIAEGYVHILLGSARYGRPLRHSDIPVVKPTLMNVSKFVCILGSDT